MRRKLAVALITIFLFSAIGSTIYASAPYRGYTYTEQWGGTASPNAYLPLKVIYPGLDSPSDFMIRNDYIYIADTGNNRIVVLDSSFEFVREIYSYINEDGQEMTFSSPEGLFVNTDHDIYIADTENNQIVVLNTNGELIRIIGEPRSDILPADFRYFPTRVAVSRAGRIYVIGRGIFHGIIEFDPDGNFSRFMGTNRVSFNPLDYLWRRFATEEQRRRMAVFLPTSFNSLEIDDIGFIFTTVTEEGSDNPVQRLNPGGIDVIRFPQGTTIHPVGDLSFVSMGAQGVTFSGTSIFVDVTVNEYGMYAVLDSKRGRVFVYSADSQLLYIFGKYGIQEGTFRVPIGISWFGEDILVLDRGNNSITVFTPTEYGNFINNAIKNHIIGNDDLTTYYWNRVLQLNTNYALAHVGIGRSLYRQGYYREAMEYFMRGNNRFYYSRAFANFRREFLRDNLGYVLTGIVILCVGLVALNIRKRAKHGIAE